MSSGGFLGHRRRAARYRLGPDIESGDVIGIAAPLARSVDAVIIEAIAQIAVAAIWLRRDIGADPRLEAVVHRQAEMHIEPRHGGRRIADQVAIADMEDALGRQRLARGDDPRRALGPM